MLASIGEENVFVEQRRLGDSLTLAMNAAEKRR